MTLSLIPRPTRIKSSRVEATRQLIVFTLRQHRFALPIQVAKKVVVMGSYHSYTPDFNKDLMLFQHQEISIINAEERIFCDGTQQKLLPSTRLEDDRRDAGRSQENASLYYLLVVQNLQGDVVGLPISTQPTLQLAPESAFTPLSSTYLNHGGLRCVSAMVAIDPDESPIFLLNLQQLVQSPLVHPQVHPQVQPQLVHSEAPDERVPSFAARI